MAEPKVGHGEWPMGAAEFLECGKKDELRWEAEEATEAELDYRSGRWWGVGFKIREMGKKISRSTDVRWGKW